MQETYIIWQNKSSKDFNLICESVIVSQPEQKLKILSTSNKDNNYNYSYMNNRNRPYFENRIITVSSYFKFENLTDKSNKLSKIMNWLYSYKDNSIIQILPDYSNVNWVNAKLENVQTVEVVATHTVKIIFQFRVDAFSVDKQEKITTSNSINFTRGKYNLIYNNIGFYTENIKLVLKGACNWTTITNLDNNKVIDIKNGFSSSCEIDFVNKKILIDKIETVYDIDYFEIAPGINNFKLESDGNYSIEFRAYNNYLYSYTKGEQNTIEISLIEG